MSSSTQKAVNIIGFDTEDDSQGDVYLLVFYDGKNYYRFSSDDFDCPKDAALFWLFFSKRKGDTILFCVNTEYDINNLSWGEDRKYIIERFYNKGSFILSKLYIKPDVKFYDLMNYYSLSAKKVGELFGLQKLDMNFEAVKKYKSGSKKGKVKITKQMLKYCDRDTEIAYTAGEFILKKFDEYQIKFTPTVASASLQIYLKHYSPIRFDIGNVNRFKIRQEDVYASYFGGRTELFRYGKVKGSLKYFDINSLYPSVMRDELFPNPFSRMAKTTNMSLKEFKQVENGFGMFDVEVPKSLHIPPLPVKMKLKTGIKLIFPTGKFTGYWTVVELKNAMKYGVKVKKIHYLYEFEEMIDLFSDFVNDMYEKRMKSKTMSDNKFYKVNMNSLYGKFAEKRRAVKYIDIEDGGVFDPIVFDKAQTSEEYLPFHNNTIISSYVTSYARIKLYDYMMMVLKEGYEVLYCDTDSIIYKGAKNVFKETKELGGMKKEFDIVKAEFRGAKYYCYELKNGDKHFVCKGVPKHKQQEMFRDKEATWKKPIRFTEAKRRNLQPNIWTNFTKRDLNKFDKRTIDDNGYSTTAIHLKNSLTKRN